MIRKTTAAVVLVGALALGTASATSLGTFDDIGFAASTVDLVDCELAQDAIALLPDIPADGDPVGALSTFSLGSIDLTALLTDAPDCLDTDKVLDLVLVDASQNIIETVSVTLTSTNAASPIDLTSLTATDITSIHELRLVVRNA